MRRRPVDIKVEPSGNEVLSVRFPTELLTRMEAGAEQAGQTMSEYVRRRFSDPPQLSQVRLSPPTENPTSQTWMLREQA